MDTRSTISSVVIAIAVLLTVAMGTPGSAQVCGDGVVESTEECDDGAGFRLDGCTPDCAYEHVQRMIHLELAGGSPSPVDCTPRTNAFGSAFSTLGLAGVNAQLAAAIADGTLNQLVQVLGLDDPAAVDDPDLDVGILAAGVDPRGSAPGLDGWFIAATGALDDDDLPAIRLPGSVAARELAAGPQRIDVAFLDGTITIRDARVAAEVGTAISLPAPPPDEFATGFLAFETMQAMDGTHGLCGNLTVGSLAVLPAPFDFSSGGAAECSASCPGSRGYTWCGTGNPVGPGCNSMLDVVVSGCAVSPPLCIPVINPTQPDVGTSGQPPVTLVADPTTGKVTVPEPEDAYSTWLEFAAERVHVTNHLGGIFADGFESSNLGAWSSSQP